MTNVYFVRRLHGLLSCMEGEVLPPKVPWPAIRTIAVSVEIWDELVEMRTLVAAWLAALEATEPAAETSTIEPVSAERARAINQMLRWPGQ